MNTVKSEPIPAKVGTQPAIIYVESKSHIKVGNKIRFRDWQKGSKWQEGEITVPLRISL